MRSTLSKLQVDLVTQKISRPLDVLNATIPFEHEHLTVCVACSSLLLRTKINQAFVGHDVQVFETADMAELVQFILNFHPKVVFLGFRFFQRSEFPGELHLMHPEHKPRLVLTGTDQELESDLASKGVDALLCLPFIPEMLLMKINSVLKPGKDWQHEDSLVLRKMRKYQRFSVNQVFVHLLKPTTERNQVLDISYQGIKMITSQLTPLARDQIFQMQITCDGASILMEARLMWVRENHAGFRFRKERPPGFDGFFRRVLSQAQDID